MGRVDDHDSHDPLRAGGVDKADRADGSGVYLGAGEVELGGLFHGRRGKDFFHMQTNRCECRQGG